MGMSMCQHLYINSLNIIVQVMTAISYAASIKTTALFKVTINDGYKVSVLGISIPTFEPNRSNRHTHIWKRNVDARRSSLPWIFRAP